MDYSKMKKAQLIEEIETLQEKIAELGRTQAERKRAEEALRESARRYHLLAEHVTDVIWTMDMDLQFTYISPSVTDMLGYSVEEAMAQTLEEVLTPASFEVARKALAEALAVAEPKDLLELELNRKDGSTVWTEVKMAFLRDPDGRPVGILGVARDITERKEAEQALRKAHDELEIRVQERTADLAKINEELRIEIAERVRAEQGLRESEEQLRLVVQNMPVMLDAFDADGNIIVWNQECERVTGYRSDEMVGSPRALELLYPDKAYLQRVLAEWAERGDTFRNWELELTSKDGDVKTVSWSNLSQQFPIPSWNSWAVGVDITERKQAEEALHRSLEETERGHRMLLALSQAAQAVQRARTPDEVYQTVGNEIAGLGYHAVILTLTDDRAHLVISYLTLEPAWVRAVEKLAGFRVQDYRLPLVPGGSYQRIIAEGEATFTERTAEFMAEALPEPLRPLAGRLAAQLGVDQYIFAPLMVGGEAQGVLAVGGTGLTEAGVPAVTAFANQAAIAIENARLFEAEREQRELAEALQEAAAAVSSTLDLDEVLDHILEQVERAVDGDSFSVILIEDDIARLTRWRGYELPGERTQPLRFDIPMAKYPNLIKMARTGKPVIVPDTALDPDWVPAARDQEWRRSYVGVPIRLGGATVGFLGVSGTRPGQFGPEDARRMEGLASHAAAAIENARLYDEIQQKVEELGLLLDTVTAASSTLEPDRILRTLADKMTTSVGATFCRIALLDEMNQSLTIRTAFAAHDLDWDPGLGRRYALADAPWHRQVIERGQIMILRQDDPSKAASETECRITLSEGIQSALLIPLVIGDCTLGVVSLGEMRRWERIPFTADRVRLCQAMANQTAVAVRNAQLLDAVMEHRRDLQKLSTQLVNAQEAERKRISRELHDEMGQALTMMSINLAAIEKELPSELAPTIRERLAETSSLADQVLGQIRELSLDLRPTMLDDLGLVSTLRWYVNRYAKRLNIEVEFEAIDLEDRLTADIETVLYRVAQEALTNVARHAQANRVRLLLERKESTVVAFIEDDGQGFDVEKLAGPEAPERGVGLLDIRERVTSLGGSFSIQSGPGQGTRLSVEIPIVE